MKTTVLMCTLFSAAAFAKGPAAEWDAKAATELKAMCEKFNDAWMKQDTDALKAPLSDQMWGAWDLDMMGRPAGWASKAELSKFFDEAMGMAKKMGMTFKWTNTKIECKANGNLGICFVEGDTTMTMPKMPPMSMAVRNTEVFAKEKGAWKFVHHHGSVAKAPQMPPKMMAMNSKSATWMDAGAEMPGVKIAPIWMNPVTMQSAAMMKSTQLWKQPRHIHPFGMTMAVLEGSITTSDPNGKDVEYGPGSVLYRAANEPHQTTLKPGAVLMMVGDGPMMSIPVDDKGNPLPQK